MTLNPWPPPQFCRFTLRGTLFEQEAGEPYVTRWNRSPDVDQERLSPGWLNRIQRYGLVNGIPEAEWHEDTVSFCVLSQMPEALRRRWAPAPPDLTMNEPTVHAAPVQKEWLLAANAASESALAGMTIGGWLRTLKAWKAGFPDDARVRDKAGPLWWWCAHSVALNPSGGTVHKPDMTPHQFLVYWLGLFPCKKCRRKFGARIKEQPPSDDWAEFPAWVSAAHDWVTAHKDD